MVAGNAFLLVYGQGLPDVFNVASYSATLTKQLILHVLGTSVSLCLIECSLYYVIHWKSLCFVDLVIEVNIPWN